MKSTGTAAAFVASFLLSQAFAQQNYTFQTVDFPNSLDGTAVRGIDSAGDVVGYFGTNSKTEFFIYVGFTRLASGRFVTVEDPLTASSCNAFGISDSGVVVGAYENDGFRGFVYSQGNYQTIAVVTQSQVDQTLLTGISTNNLIVGNYFLGSTIVGFQRSPTGSIQDLPKLNGQFVHASSINSSGVIVGLDGSSVVPGVQSDGFILAPGGFYQTVNYPGAISTFLSGINDSGTIVGFQFQKGNGSPASFVYANGQFTDIAFPGAGYTQAFGINASGVIAGTYGDLNSSVTHGFIASPVH